MKRTRKTELIPLLLM